MLEKKQNLILMFYGILQNYIMMQEEVLYSLTPILGEVSAHPLWLDFVKEVVSLPNITNLTCYTNGILLHRFGFRKF